ncbi:MAG: FHA domain-containing protein [Sciscionella sp.]
MSAPIGYRSPAAPQAPGLQSPTRQHLRPATDPDDAYPTAPRHQHIPAIAPLLHVVRGPRAGALFALPPGRTTLGRGSDCDIALAQNTVSRHHATLSRVGGETVLIDGGSLNGTYVNRHPTDRAVLADGDEIWIGATRLLFHDQRPPAARIPDDAATIGPASVPAAC